MAKKNRRRSKKKKQHEDEPFYGDEEIAPLAKGQDIITDHVFPLLKFFRIPINRSLFKPFGFECVECEWITIKNGVPGRNAMRAHMKRHLNERRARDNLRLYVWGGVLFLLVILVVSLVPFVDRVPIHISTHWLTPSTLTGLALTGASTLSGCGLLVFARLHELGRSKLWRRGYSASITLGILVLVAEATLASGITGIEVTVPWLLSGLLPIIGLALTRTDVGKTKLLRSRREERAPKYIRRYKAITAVGDMEYKVLQSKIDWLIRKKRIQPRSFKKWQLKGLRTMGVKLYTSRPKQAPNRPSRR
jgi:hypothetical protein